LVHESEEPVSDSIRDGNRCPESTMRNPETH